MQVHGMHVQGMHVLGMHAASDVPLLCCRYVSCVVGCPYQGAVEPAAAAAVAAALHQMGCYEVSMGDTTGVGTPASMAAMWEVSSGFMAKQDMWQNARCEPSQP